MERKAGTKTVKKGYNEKTPVQPQGTFKPDSMNKKEIGGQVDRIKKRKEKLANTKS